MKQEKLFGVLYVESTETNAFDELDVKTLEALANQASASLQRASLYLQTQNNLLTLATIQDVSRSVRSTSDHQPDGGQKPEGSIWVHPCQYLYFGGGVSSVFPRRWATRKK